MLLSPISLPETTIRRPVRVAPPPAPEPPAFRTALRVWLALGLVVLLCVPAARGDALLGATVPYWLVGAPAIGLVWLSRQRVFARVATPRQRPAPRQQAYRSGASRRSRVDRSNRR